MNSELLQDSYLTRNVSHLTGIIALGDVNLNIIIIIIIYFDSGGMAHKNNRQITIDNTRKYRKTDRHNDT